MIQKSDVKSSVFSVEKLCDDEYFGRVTTYLNMVTYSDAVNCYRVALGGVSWQSCSEINVRIQREDSKYLIMVRFKMKHDSSVFLDSVQDYLNKKDFPCRKLAHLISADLCSREKVRDFLDSLVASFFTAPSSEECSRLLLPSGIPSKQIKTKKVKELLSVG